MCQVHEESKRTKLERGWLVFFGTASSQIPFVKQFCLVSVRDCPCKDSQSLLPRRKPTVRQLMSVIPRGINYNHLPKPKHPVNHEVRTTGGYRFVRTVWLQSSRLLFSDGTESRVHKNVTK